MSAMNVRDWLVSQNRFATESLDSKCSQNAKTIAITSGKGGVGKTSACIKLGKLIAKRGSRVLLIDCDYNLSNTNLKLGLPVTSHFFSLISAEKQFDECIHKDGNFHLLAGCNGHLELFERGLELDRLIIDIINEHQSDYDYILLDSPAGIGRENLTLNAYCDHRFVVVTPDKSSITDSYSLMKILNNKYGIKENHLIVNKVSSGKQYLRMVRILSETVENYLSGRLQVLGGIKKEDKAVDLFDGILLNDEKSEIHKNFLKVLDKFTDESRVKNGRPLYKQSVLGQEVQPMVSQGVL